MAEPETERHRSWLRGAAWRATLVLFIVVGAWVTISSAYEWARPFLRYFTVASVAFTLGRFSRRRARDQR